MNSSALGRVLTIRILKWSNLTTLERYEKDQTFAYASEADLLNLALWGCTAAHVLPLQDTVDSLQMICRRNGGSL